MTEQQERAVLQLLLLPAHVDFLRLTINIECTRMMGRVMDQSCCCFNGRGRYCRGLRGNEKSSLDADKGIACEREISNKSSKMAELRVRMQQKHSGRLT